ncbi:Zn-ribbon domain-containing OB-fold protein [Allopusillimonas ginsengisoli]|uniref:Zn-ribbon domain-containing OB-fold protein n=1 Tax=Allopusillimonas ginsengisoli TaxID=453575 RepID=UPI0014301B4C|nr:zinc ribbon domain-containing protein [Allopusillimonas ginsengisoli]
MSDQQGMMPAAGAEATYFGFLRSGIWNIQQCQTCNRWIFYPREYCPHCQSPELRWRAPTGLGTVYSMSRVFARDGKGPLVLLVDLDEGVRIMGGAAEDNNEGLTIGARVSARLDNSGEESRILFVPMRGAQHEA